MANDNSLSFFDELFSRNHFEESLADAADSLCEFKLKQLKTTAKQANWKTNINAELDDGDISTFIEENIP